MNSVLTMAPEGIRDILGRLQRKIAKAEIGRGDYQRRVTLFPAADRGVVDAELDGAVAQ